MIKFCVASAFVLALISFDSIGNRCVGQIIDAKITQSRISSGENLKATVKGSGKIGVESSIASMSFEHDLANAEVDFGKVTSPGFHSVRLVNPDGQESVVFSIMVAPTNDRNLFEVLAVSHPLTKTEPNELTIETLKTFSKNITTEHLEEALSSVLTHWLRDNAAALSGTFTFCSVCLIPNPTSPVACPVCVESAKGQTIDLGLELAKALVKIQIKKNLIKPEQGAKLISVIEIGEAMRSIRSIVNAGDKLEKTLAILDIATEFALENDTVKAVIYNATGEAGKVHVWIKIMKKVK